MLGSMVCWGLGCEKPVRRFIVSFFYEPPNYEGTSRVPAVTAASFDWLLMGQLWIERQFSKEVSQIRDKPIEDIPKLQ